MYSLSVNTRRVLGGKHILRPGVVGTVAILVDGVSRSIALTLHADNVVEGITGADHNPTTAVADHSSDKKNVLLTGRRRGGRCLVSARRQCAGLST